jgi:hypothetical protein
VIPTSDLPFQDMQADVNDGNDAYVLNQIETPPGFFKIVLHILPVLSLLQLHKMLNLPPQKVMTNSLTKKVVILKNLLSTLMRKYCLQIINNHFLFY